MGRRGVDSSLQEVLAMYCCASLIRLACYLQIASSHTNRVVIVLNFVSWAVWVGLVILVCHIPSCKR